MKPAVQKDEKRWCVNRTWRHRSPRMGRQSPPAVVRDRRSSLPHSVVPQLVHLEPLPASLNWTWVELNKERHGAPGQIANVDWR